MTVCLGKPPCTYNLVQKRNHPSMAGSATRSCCAACPGGQAGCWGPRLSPGSLHSARETPEARPNAEARSSAHPSHSTRAGVAPAPALPVEPACTRAGMGPWGHLAPGCVAASRALPLPIPEARWQLRRVAQCQCKSSAEHRGHRQPCPLQLCPAPWYQHNLP